MDNVTERLNFEKKVVIDGHTKRIDVYIPETRVIIEQKSLGKALDQKIRNSGEIDLTPFEQADRYNSKLTFDERARWIVTSNFAEIWIYDMNEKQPEPTKIALEELQNKYPLLDFLVKKDVKKISHEMEISIQAGDIVGLIYDAFLEQYHIPDIQEKREHKLKSLNALCVRLVFCLYAEDAGIFGSRGMFHDYLENYNVKDCRRALIELFKVLDTPVAERDEYLEENLAQFPYVNGGLFADENIEIPPFTEEIKELLLTKASEDFDWRDISPTIFGAVFESTLNPETRRSGGMHYTSIENIHKVIDPLFMDDLKQEFATIKEQKVKKTKDEQLDAFQNKLASLTFLDPACGSGNFLTETYLSLTRLENEVIREKIGGQMTMGEYHDPIKVSIQQFYGIEINDFAVTVGKTALWIAESQMLEETKSIVYGFNDDFLPLKTYVNITEANALRIDWNDVVPAEKLNYIMGNPPFVGSSIKSKAEQQKKDKENVFGNAKAGKLDYVACWYKKANDYIQNTRIKVAFVSTNSITQGEQVRPLWEEILTDTYINFAYRTFQWDSEAHIKAHVHCVIIAFSKTNEEEKFIVEDKQKQVVNYINGYLVNAPNFYINSRGKAPSNMPKLTQGNKPWDDGGLILTPDERKVLIGKYPQLETYIKPYMGSRDFINHIERYCFWFVGANPSEYRNIPEIRERLQIVADIRSKSPTVAVQKQASTPALFSQIRQPVSEYIMVPETSGASRRYIPMGFMPPDVIASNSVMTAENATLYMFGTLQSNVHMAWVRTLCGRLKSDYRYSPALYNNFPWPGPTEDQKAKIEQTAQGILDARALYPDSSLADLYDPLTMPIELRRAHVANDKAVMAAYGFSVKMTESDCVAELMKLYQQKVEELEKH
jgi:type I restriction-modification system DNA methylase subunit